jgi:hypothetical protein
MEPMERLPGNAIIVDGQRLQSEGISSFRVLLPVSDMKGTRSHRYVRRIAEYLSSGSDDPVRMSQERPQAFDASDHPDSIHQHQKGVEWVSIEIHYIGNHDLVDSPLTQDRFHLWKNIQSRDIKPASEEIQRVATGCRPNVHDSP